MGASEPKAVGNGFFRSRKSLPLLRMRPLYAGVCACLGVSAYGQQQPVDAGATAIEEVTVTGSRIVRRDLDAPSPILTVDSEAFDQNSNIGVEAVLNQYPQFNPGATQFSASNVTPNSADTPGVSTLNMRGLGDGRGLVLVDGRRVQPVNAALAIDTNMIPVGDDRERRGHQRRRRRHLRLRRVRGRRQLQAAPRLRRRAHELPARLPRGG